MTLALGITNAVTIPASVVEPLFALLIVLLCVENAYHRTGRWHRLGLIFLFGRQDGLGFADELGKIGLEADRYAILLLAFNLGVELGQLSIILLCYVLVDCFVHRPGYRSIVWFQARYLLA